MIALLKVFRLLIKVTLELWTEKDINELIGLVTAWNKSGYSRGNGRSRLDDKLIDIGH